MPKTDFTPFKHGFHFGNNFVNKIISTSFGKIESRGRCGGMAYAALDYFFSGIPVPSHESKDFPNRNYPPDGSLLSDYIYERTINSLFTLYSFKFFDWTVQKDSQNSIRKSVGYKTKTEEILVRYLVKNVGQFPSNIKYLDIPEQIKSNKNTILPGETIELVSTL